MTKPIVILDLDLTLIHAVPTSDIQKKYKDKVEMASKLSSLKLHDMEEDGKSYYLVFERPGLQDFLDYLFKNFRVIVWTAATKAYAAFIIEKILLQGKDRKIEFVFVHHHCKRSKRRYGNDNPKNLEMLMNLYKIPDMKRTNTFIIDDHPDVKEKNGNMCISAPEYIALNEDTMELSTIAHSDDFLQKLKVGLDKYLVEFKRNDGIVEDVNKFM